MREHMAIRIPVCGHIDFRMHHARGDINSRMQATLSRVSLPREMWTPRTIAGAWRGALAAWRGGGGGRGGVLWRLRDAASCRCVHSVLHCGGRIRHMCMTAYGSVHVGECVWTCARVLGCTNYRTRKCKSIYVRAADVATKAHAAAAREAAAAVCRYAFANAVLCIRDSEYAGGGRSEQADATASAVARAPAGGGGHVLARRRWGNA